MSSSNDMPHVQAANAEQSHAHLHCEGRDRSVALGATQPEEKLSLQSAKAMLVPPKGRRGRVLPWVFWVRYVRSACASLACYARRRAGLS